MAGLEITSGDSGTSMLKFTMGSRVFFPFSEISMGTAALYLARARYRVLVMEKDHFGGQITITHEVVNYPGVGRTSGKELTETMRLQAQAFGAEFLLAEVESLELEGDIKTVRTVLILYILYKRYPSSAAADGADFDKCLRFFIVIKVKFKFIFSSFGSENAAAASVKSGNIF